MFESDKVNYSKNKYDFLRYLCKKALGFYKRNQKIFHYE